MEGSKTYLMNNNKAWLNTHKPWRFLKILIFCIVYLPCTIAFRASSSGYSAAWDTNCATKSFILDIYTYGYSSYIWKILYSTHTLAISLFKYIGISYSLLKTKKILSDQIKTFKSLNSLFKDQINKLMIIFNHMKQNKDVGYDNVPLNNLYFAGTLMHKVYLSLIA